MLLLFANYVYIDFSLFNNGTEMTNQKDYKQELASLVVSREPTGLKDKNGKEIFTGDIVEFFFDEFGGHGSADSGFTRMRDIVIKDGDSFYFACGVGWAFAWRHNAHCEIIGTDFNLIVP